MHSQEHTPDTHPTGPAAPWCAENGPSKVGSHTLSAARDADMSGGSRRSHTAGSQLLHAAATPHCRYAGFRYAARQYWMHAAHASTPVQCVAAVTHTRNTPNNSTHMLRAPLSPQHTSTCECSTLCLAEHRAGLLRCRCSSGQSMLVRKGMMPSQQTNWKPDTPIYYPECVTPSLAKLSPLCP